MRKGVEAGAVLKTKRRLACSAALWLSGGFQWGLAQRGGAVEEMACCRARGDGRDATGSKFPNGAGLNGTGSHSAQALKCAAGQGILASDFRINGAWLLTN